MELDHTRADKDQSLNRRSFSNYNNNAFVTFEAPPPPARKKVAEKVKRDNRLTKSGKKATAPSNNNGKAMTYANLLWPRPKASMSCWGRVRVLARVRMDDGWTVDWFSQIWQSVERSCEC